MTETTMRMDPEGALRDLLWVVNSPSLIQSDIHSTIPAETLDPDRVDAQHLQAFLTERPTRRVGHYFERLVLYWLTHIRGVRVVAHGLQIREGGVTRGEIDFVYWDEDDKLTHWEVAVKFYLYEHEVLPGRSHFIGPIAHDTFEKKVERLFGHQLPLGRTRYPEIEVSGALVKGRIFYDRGQSLPQRLPPRMSPDHLRGRFLRLRDLHQLETLSGTAFKILPKPFWLSTHHPWGAPGMNPQQTVDHLREHFASTETPLLLSQFEPKTDCDSALETQRLFVVADHWPESQMDT